MSQDLEIGLLRTFVTVIECDGFSRAGQVIGRTQSAVSLQIQRLEDLTGATLINRTSHSLKLTETGQTLYEYARRILQLNDEALDSLVQTKLSGTVRLGAPNEFAGSLLPQILGTFAQIHPKVRLDVQFDLSKTLLARMSKGEFDLIIALHDKSDDTPGVKVVAERLVWITSVDREPHMRTPLPLVAAPQPCIYRKRMIESLNAIKKPWNVGYTSASYSGIVAAVRAGLGVTVLAKSTIPQGVRVLTTRDELPSLGNVEVRLHFPQGQVTEAVNHLGDQIRAKLETHYELLERSTVSSGKRA